MRGIPVVGNNFEGTFAICSRCKGCDVKPPVLHFLCASTDEVRWANLEETPRLRWGAVETKVYLSLNFCHKIFPGVQYYRAVGLVMFGKIP